MAELRHCAGFAAESLAEHFVVHVLLVHDFRGHFAPEPRVDAAVDGGHAAAGDWAVDNVTPIQCRACAQGCHVHQSRIADRERTNES